MTSRARIKQPMPSILSPLATVVFPGQGEIEIFPTEEYRVFFENSNFALFQDGRVDVTVGLDEDASGNFTVGGDLTVAGSATIAGTVNGRNMPADGSKLDGIAPNATANATDAQLRDRATHTGSQAIATITGLQTALDGKVGKTTIAAIATDMSSDAFADELKGKVNAIIAAIG